MKQKTVYGMHAVKAVLERRPECVDTLYLQDSLQKNTLKPFILLANDAGIAVEFESKKTIGDMADTTQHQGIVVTGDVIPKYTEEDLWGLIENANDTKHGDNKLVILDGVQDPHNLGACMRVADGAGCLAVIVPKDRAASVTAAVCKVASGAIESTPLIPVTNLARTMQRLKQQHYWLWGLSESAGTRLGDANISGNTAYVFGAEGSGLRQSTEKHCDGLFSIPMKGLVESLNVSVAVGIALYCQPHN